MKKNQIVQHEYSNDFSSLFDRSGEINEKTLDDVFGDFTLDDELALKLDEISADLTVMMLEAKKNRTELSELLGWKKSRITKILSGQENLTIKTIFLIAKKLGWDYDIKYRHPEQERPLQPWHSQEPPPVSVDTQLQAWPTLIIQSHQEVKNDFARGVQRNMYISVMSDYASPNNDFIDFSFDSEVTALNLEPSTRIDVITTAKIKKECIYE